MRTCSQAHAEREKPPWHACLRRRFCARGQRRACLMARASSARALRRARIPTWWSLTLPAARASTPRARTLSQQSIMRLCTGRIAFTSSTKCTCCRNRPLMRCLKRSKNLLSTSFSFCAPPKCSKFPKRLFRAASVSISNRLRLTISKSGLRMCANVNRCARILRRCICLLSAQRAACVTRLPCLSRQFPLEMEP